MNRMAQSNLRNEDSNIAVGHRRPGQLIVNSDSLTDARITDQQGRDIGMLADILIDVTRGRIAYAILLLGGRPATADSLRAIPWTILTLDAEEARFIVSADVANIENAPALNDVSWSDLADGTVANIIHGYYSCLRYWENVQTKRPD